MNFRKNISLNRNVRGMGKSSTLAINERSAELAQQGRKVYRLGLGQSPFPGPDSIQQALQISRAIPQGRPALPRWIFSTGRPVTPCSPKVPWLPGTLKLIITAFLLARILPAASPAPVYAPNGMVVSASRWASQAGVDILQQGGNAVDAAVATGFTLAVTYPQAGNIGGGGFMVAHLAGGEAFTLDYREMAPGRAQQDMYLDQEGNVIPDLSLYAHLAAGVPGSVAGLLKAWEDHGSGQISRREILAPAIRLARQGFILTHAEVRTLNGRREFFARDDGARAIFIRSDDMPWQAGDRLVQRDLAKTLQRIARRGRAGFYQGVTAELVEQEMETGGGLITAADLENYHSKYRPPLTGRFRDYLIISMGPPSSGGVLLVQMLNMAENFPLDTLGWNSSDYLHLLTEIQRRAYADRAEHLGDPDFWEVPIEMLTSVEYARQRAAEINPHQATPSSQVYAGDPAVYESLETTHYSVVDRFGNAVSVTTTLNTSYGCGVVVSGAGFFLNNEMDDFSAKPGVPNYFGLLGGRANAIAAGKRPLSSMTPTIVLKDDQPFLIIGSPGGAKIITTVLQTILNVTLFGMDIQQAVDAPRVHSQWLPDLIMTEPWSLPRDVARNLAARGHVLQPYRGGIGQANGILITPEGYFGAPDPRGTGNTALGY